jgi:D-alanyl-D-alanine carboxypeptidase
VGVESSDVLAALALPATLLALAPYHASVEPLPQPVQAQLKSGGFWHKGCPVGLSNLRLLTVRHWGWDGRQRTGQLVVNAAAARPLARVFGQLYGLHFPIRHMLLSDMYGPKSGRPSNGDVTASFECRQSVPSPCVGGNASGRWSMHAYGLAVDVNPLENPYVGCGQSRDPAARPYFNRSKHRRGMVTARVIAAFRSIGWGWGGAWTGNTKDYMHFSSTGG